MIRRTVEVSSPAYLRVERSQLVIERDGERAGQVPLEDLGVLVVDNPGAVFTQSLLNACAEHDATVVLCDDKHLPHAILLPMQGHSVQAETIRAQTAMSLPLRKQLWRQIVRGKIAGQADVLRERMGTDAPLRELAGRVRSGDPDNVEAQAARAYWPRLFGPAFRRDREAGGVNALLNYGYAVLRAAAARAVCAAGLHPSIGLHHHNRYDALCLASDLMEPMRPLIDRSVRALADDGGEAPPLDKQAKAELLGALSAGVRIGEREFPLLVAMQTLAVSLRRAAVEGRGRLELPSLGAA